MPFPELETTRYKLRAPNQTDIANLSALLADSRVVDRHPMTPLVDDEAINAELAMMQQKNQSGEGLYWIIETKKDREFIGRLGFRRINWQNDCATIFCDTLPVTWGQMAMLEVGQVAIQFAFQNIGLHRIDTLVLPSNRVMHLFLQKIGFTREGIIRNCIKHNNQYLDFDVYSILEHESNWGPLQF